MYRHDIIDSGMHTVMRHYRETPSESGLIAVRELGHTVGIPRRNHLSNRSDSIVMPDILSRVLTEASRLDRNERAAGPTEQISCENLDAFVNLGIERWKKLSQFVGTSISLNVHLVEDYEPVENVSPHGVILVHDKPQAEFIGYAASPEEIDAMERIAAFACNAELSETPGVYL